MLTVNFKMLRPEAGDIVLDAGAGEGRHTFALCREGCRVFALDRDLTSLNKARYALKDMENKGFYTKNVVILQGDNLRLPFPDHTFHKIICAEVMEHIHEDDKAAEEFFRVLRPGGDIAVTVPTPFTERIYGGLSERYFNTPGGHIRIYQPKELGDVLRAAGFRITGMSFAHAFHSLYWVLRCLCGLDNDQAAIPKLYHRFLHKVVLDPILMKWEKSCNRIFPKSIVIYAQKP